MILINKLLDAYADIHKLLTPEVREAAERVRRIDAGEGVMSVYPDSDGDKGSTVLTDTERLADFALAVIAKLEGE